MLPYLGLQSHSSTRTHSLSLFCSASTLTVVAFTKQMKCTDSTGSCFSKRSNSLNLHILRKYINEHHSAAATHLFGRNTRVRDKAKERYQKRTWHITGGDRARIISSTLRSPSFVYLRGAQQSLWRRQQSRLGRRNSLALIKSKRPEAPQQPLVLLIN